MLTYHVDDLPEIKKNIQQGFETTTKTVTKWFNDIQRKLDGDESNDPIPRPGGSQQQQQQRRQDFGPSQSSQLYGIQRSAERRSADRDRYDHDPQLLGDDFAHRLELRDEEGKYQEPRYLELCLTHHSAPYKASSPACQSRTLQVKRRRLNSHISTQNRTRSSIIAGFGNR
jgi:hypothetical protein